MLLYPLQGSCPVKSSRLHMLDIFTTSCFSSSSTVECSLELLGVFKSFGKTVGDKIEDDVVLKERLEATEHQGKSLR